MRIVIYVYEEEDAVIHALGEEATVIHALEAEDTVIQDKCVGRLHTHHLRRTHVVCITLHLSRSSYQPFTSIINTRQAS